MLKNISQFFTSLKVRQLLFWALVWGGFLFFDNSQHPLLVVALRELVNTLLLALSINFNVQILIPRYLNERKYLLYFIAVAITALIITPIKLTTLYILQPSNGLALQDVLGGFPFHLLSYIIFMISSTFFQIIADWALLLQERKKLKSKTVQAELQALKNQINPHFLFNTLNNLYALTLKKSDDAPDVVLKLSDMMRYMLYEGNSGLVPLSKEIEYLQNYLDLERIRQSKHLNIVVNIDGDPSPYHIPPLLFLPFVENAVKHGLNTSIESGYLDIHLQIGDDQLAFHVRNSIGPGRKERHSAVGGVGIPNVKNRLKLLYTNTSELIIREKEYEYHITLLLHSLTPSTKLFRL